MGCLRKQVSGRFLVEVKTNGVTRAMQDEFAVGSHKKASAAQKAGMFDKEIVGIDAGKKLGVITADETIRHDASVEGIAKLPTVFEKDGTVTAANSSKISDGAAATVLMTQDEAEKRGLEPLARIVAHATYAHEPEWFTTAPSTAIALVVEKAGWTMADVDLFEINEAFATVTMAAMADNGLDHDKVNVNGGACALGHPLGASGARIIVTLIYALKRLGKKRGVASLCIGGGEATAVAIELA